LPPRARGGRGSAGGQLQTAARSVRPGIIMAEMLRQQRVEARRLCEDRRQLLELTLLHWNDRERLQPPGEHLRIMADHARLASLNVQALLQHEGDIDLRHEDFVYHSAANETGAELVSDFKLEGQQLALAAYELLLLFMPPTFADPDVASADGGGGPAGVGGTGGAVDTDFEGEEGGGAWCERDELLDEIRLNLNISQRQHKIAAPRLEVDHELLPAGMQEQPIVPTSLHHRFQMLACQLPSYFADDSQFEKWQERQMAFFIMGLRAEFAALEWVRGAPFAEASACEELFQNLLDMSRPERGLIVTRKSEGFPSAEYIACIEKINRFLCDIVYPQLATAGARLDASAILPSGGCCSSVPHSWPLNTALYGKLFETCFDAQERGSFSAHGKQTLAFLTRASFREALGITEQMKTLSYAYALCHELSADSESSIKLMATLKEQIFCITPQMIVDADAAEAAAAEGAARAAARGGNEAAARAVAQRWGHHAEGAHRAAQLQKLRDHFREVLLDYQCYHNDHEKNVGRIEAYLDVCACRAPAVTILAVLLRRRRRLGCHGEMASLLHDRAADPVCARVWRGRHTWVGGADLRQRPGPGAAGVGDDHLGHGVHLQRPRRHGGCLGVCGGGGQPT
jgi:hypothetical protein